MFLAAAYLKRREKVCGKGREEQWEDSEKALRQEELKDAWGGKREQSEQREAGGPSLSVGCQGAAASSMTGAFGEQDKLGPV